MRETSDTPQKLTDLPKAFFHAGEGLLHVVKSQRNARIHGVLTGVALTLALWLGLSAIQWAILMLTIGFVFATEAINTAIEATIDLVSPDTHPLAKIAKDAAAGAVLVAAFSAVAVAVVLVIHRLANLLGM
ncbi:MAG: diacylglycerol kinase family protein [Chloroflexi bacterium]|nr:diacylglycerol kinase family protein [Chloroflexota bacterium]